MSTYYQLDLVALRELAKEASPGPWRSMRNGNSWDGKHHCGSSRIEEVPRTFHEMAFVHQADPHLLTLRDDDADYIVAACNALPALLDRIEALSAAPAAPSPDLVSLEELAGRLTRMARTYQSNGFPASTIDTASILVEAATAIRSVLKAQPNAGPSA